MKIPSTRNSPSRTPCSWVNSMSYLGSMKKKLLATSASTVATRPGPSPPNHAATITAAKNSRNGDPWTSTPDSTNFSTSASPTAASAMA